MVVVGIMISSIDLMCCRDFGEVKRCIRVVKFAVLVNVWIGLPIEEKAKVIPVLFCFRSGKMCLRC